MRRLLNSIKKHPTLYSFLRYDIYARIRSIGRRRLFHNIYENNLWDGTFSASGPGSSLESTKELREQLPSILTTLSADSLLDIPCGDFRWMRLIAPELKKYTGADIVLPLIRRNREMFGELGDFICLDLLRDSLPSVDIIFCRDCLVHLSYRECNLAIQNIIAAKPKYLITTTFPKHQNNNDTVTPYWRPLNLQAAPFGFPEPLYLIRDYSHAEGDHDGKHLGVWRTRDLA